MRSGEGVMVLCKFHREVGRFDNVVEGEFVKTHLEFQGSWISGHQIQMEGQVLICSKCVFPL